MVKIYGRLNSINVQKVMWCAAEVGLDVTHENVGGAFGGNDTAAYLAKNPNGRVPLLEDGNFLLWESNAIVRYLSECYGEAPFFPADLQTRAQAGQWMDWASIAVSPSLTKIFWTLIRTAAADRDMEEMAAAEKALLPCWDILNRHLADRNFILGDSFTMADIPLGCACYRWNALDIDHPRFDAMQRWYQRLQDRPAYRQHAMIPLT